MWAHQPSTESSQQIYWVLKVMAGIAKRTTTPAHMTTLYTLYTVGLTKGFHSPHRKFKDTQNKGKTTHPALAN